MERGENHLASWEAGQSEGGCPGSLQLQQWEVSGMHQQEWGFHFLPSQGTHAFVAARFVALVSWTMPATAVYFVLCPHTFLHLFALTVRKTWALAQTLHFPLAATAPGWLSPSVG